METHKGVQTKPQHPVFPAAGVTILRTTTAELERPTGNVSEQVCPPRGAKGHPSEICRFRKTEICFDTRSWGKILKINKPEEINGQETILGDTKKFQP